MTIVKGAEEEVDVSDNKRIIHLVANNVIDFEYVKGGEMFFSIHDYIEEVDLIFPITVSQLEEHKRINYCDNAGAFFSLILKAHKERKLVKKEED